MKKMNSVILRKAAGVLTAAAVVITSSVLPPASGSMKLRDAGSAISVSATGAAVNGNTAAGTEAAGSAVTDSAVILKTAMDNMSKSAYYKLKIKGTGDLFSGLSSDKSLKRRISGNDLSLSFRNDQKYCKLEVAGITLWVDLKKKKMYMQEEKGIYMQPLSRKDIRELTSEANSTVSSSGQYGYLLNGSTQQNARLTAAADTKINDADGKEHDCTVIKTGEIDMSSMYNTDSSSGSLNTESISSVYNGLSTKVIYTYYIDKTDNNLYGYDTEMKISYSGVTQSTNVNILLSYPNSIELGHAKAAKAKLLKGYVTRRTGIRYKVVYSKGRPVLQVTRVLLKRRSVRIPSYVKIAGKNYRVASFSSKALNGNKKVKKITGGRNIKNKKPIRSALKKRGRSAGKK